MSILLTLALLQTDLDRKVQEYLEREMSVMRAELRELIARELQDEDADVLGLGATDEKALAKALDLLTPDLLREILGTLADDKLEGRGTGTEGNNKAADYIAGKFKDAGLKPVGDKDDEGNPTYFQYFKVGSRKTQNVVGLLEGTDEKLKEQIVVLGGHYDHLGTGREKDGDSIFNGADDNASGSTTVTALALAFGKSGLRSKRSILFMTFSGEELGLLGSRHYVKNPLFKKEQHAAMLNLDMVGRNPETRVAILGVGHAKDGALEAITRAAVERTGLTHTISQESRLSFGGDSDHSSFRDEGIPAMFFFTGLHPDYHQLGDHADKIAYERMDQIGETALFVLLGMGNREKDFAFKGPRALGVMPKRVEDEDLDAAGLGEDQGALEIRSVTENSPAAKAGFREGDWVLAFDGETIPRGRKGDRTLRTAIKNAAAGADVPVTVLRDGERVALTVRFED